MRNTILIVLLSSFLLNACQLFEKKVPSEKELLQKELKAINWKEVDEFPSWANCEAISDKNKKNSCFFDYLTQLIQQKLNADTLTVLYPKLDTIIVKVTIFPDATMQFDPQIKNDTLVADGIKMDSIIKARLVDFPKVNPAIKRGIPVKTQFILPVIIKSDTN